LPPCPSE